MILSFCPKCGEKIGIPAGAGSGAQVACPLCREQYPLSDVLDRLPPMLVLLDKPHENAGGQAAGVAAAGESFAAFDQDFDSHVDSAAVDSAAVDSAGQMESGDPQWGEVESGEEAEGDPWADPGPAQQQEELALEDLEEEPAKPAAFDFGQADAPETAPKFTATPRPKRRQKGPVRLVAEIVGGGALGLALPILGMWWFGKYDPIQGMAPSVARKVPWIVPAELHGPAASSQNGPQTGASEPSSPQQDFGTDLDKLSASKFGQPQADNDRAAGFEQADPDDAAAQQPDFGQLAADEDPALFDQSEPFLDPLEPSAPEFELDVADPFAEPQAPSLDLDDPTLPDSDSTAAPADPGTGESPDAPQADLDLPALDDPLSDDPLSDDPLSDDPLSDDPLSDDPLSDEPLSDEPLSDDPLSDEPPSDEPGIDEPQEQLAGLRNAPKFSAEQLGGGLAAAAEAAQAWNTAEELDPAERRKLASGFYLALAELGEMATLVDPADEQADAQLEQVRGLLGELGGQPDRLVLIGRAAGSWLGAKKRPTNGVALSGTIKQLDALGRLYEMELELPGSSSQVISVVSLTSLPEDCRPGAQVLVLGTLVQDPADNLIGYGGDSPLVVLKGCVVVVADGP